MFAADGARYAKAIAATVAPETELVLASGSVPGRSATAFDELLRHRADACRGCGHAGDRCRDTIAKFLFTSGSTKLPKAVINTHRMWCANQQQMVESMPVLADNPVLVDWLPWNHTFGGNHNVGMVLYNGGTLYIDDGKPVPALIGETLRNLREIAPTVYFNVPTGFEAIANAMKKDEQLRRNLLSRVRMFFYAGAALAQPVWDALHEVQEREIGERIVMGTGLGMTESAPFAIYITNPNVKAGYLGVPTPGMELKLAPVDGKIEVRYRGPERHAGLLARARGHGRGLRRGRLSFVPATRCNGSPTTTCTRASSSTAASPRTSSSPPAPSSASARCARRSSPPARLMCRTR